MKGWVLLSVMLCTMHGAVLATVSGSNTAPSVQGFVSFPSADNDNEMRGFGAFANGFALEDADTSCVFNSVFPVSGPVDLNGGTLDLRHDLVFSGTTFLGSVGPVAGNGHMIDLSKSVTFIPFSTNVTFKRSLNQLASVDLTANVVSCDWSFDNQYVAIGTANIATGGGHHELRVYYFDGTSLTLTASFFDTGSVAVNAVRWHPFEHVLAIAKQDGAVTNDFGVFRLDTSNGEFSSIFQLELTNMRSVAWHPTGSYVIVADDTDPVELGLYQFINFDTTFSGSFDIPGGTRNVSFDALSWNPTGSYLAVGTEDSSAESDLFVFHLDGQGTLTVTFSVDTGENVNGLDWSPSDSFIAVGLNTSAERLRVYFFDSSIGIVTEQEAARTTEGVAVHAVHWADDGNHLLVGLASGGSTEVRVYRFSKTSFTLTLNDGIEIGTLVNGVRFSPNSSFAASTDNNDNLIIYSSPKILGLSNVLLNIDGDVVLDAPLTFQGGFKDYWQW